MKNQASPIQGFFNLLFKKAQALGQEETKTEPWATALLSNQSTPEPEAQMSVLFSSFFLGLAPGPFTEGARNKHWKLSSNHDCWNANPLNEFVCVSIRDRHAAAWCQTPHSHLHHQKGTKKCHRQKKCCFVISQHWWQHRQTGSRTAGPPSHQRPTMFTPTDLDMTTCAQLSLVMASASHRQQEQKSRYLEILANIEDPNISPNLLRSSEFQCFPILYQRNQGYG